MRLTLSILYFILFTLDADGQSSSALSGIKLQSKFMSDNQVLNDLIDFNDINYYTLKFVGAELKGKTYRIDVKEFWDGKLKVNSNIANSATMPMERLKKIEDTMLEIRVVTKKIDDEHLKVAFHFPAFTTSSVFDAVKSKNYNLRNVAEKLKPNIEVGKSFYLLAYIMPYELDGINHYCAVDASGEDIEAWGKKFGLKHYLVFEMKFEQYK